MGYRIHSNLSKSVTIHYANAPERYFQDDEMEVGPALVLDDADNMEALVLVGSPSDIADFARQILSALPTALTEQEQSYLAYICEDREYNTENGSVGRAPAGWAWFISGEDATGFDLTNEQMREVTYDD